MANLIEKAKTQIDDMVKAAYLKAAEKGELQGGAEISGTLEIPKDTAMGDYACSYAMAAAKALRMPPRGIADALVKEMELEGSFFSGAEVAGAGFINFRLSDKWYKEVLAAVQSEGEDYGRADEKTGERVMVEFVSANPTGPMTIGNARGGVLGDTLAAILDRAGCSVWREFYVNDAGNQVELFGRSIEARYLQMVLGETAVPFPEDGYHGEDIKELARELYDKYGATYADRDMDCETRRKAFADYALPRNIDIMKKHLERYRIKFDRFFLESELHDSGYVAETVKLLEANGYTYEKDGAVWLRNKDFGADKDEVLRRSNGFYTYYAVDIAYHRNKFIERGFDRVIDVWGADHHGHAIRFKATMSAPALEIDAAKLDFLIMQMVRLTRDGETIKVSKRTGKAITLNDLLDEISVDACRFFFNARPDTHLEFDMGLAVRQDSENPVYYVQYAHARICSLISALKAEGSEVPDIADIDISKIASVYEQELIKQIALFPEEIRLAARGYDPSRINRFVIELAARFHRFYNSNRIKGEEQAVLSARLKLADSTRKVIANSLAILGVTAPEKM